MPSATQATCRRAQRVTRHGTRRWEIGIDDLSLLNPSAVWFAEFSVARPGRRRADRRGLAPGAGVPGSSGIGRGRTASAVTLSMAVGCIFRESRFTPVSAPPSALPVGFRRGERTVVWTLLDPANCEPLLYTPPRGSCLRRGGACSGTTCGVIRPPRGGGEPAREHLYSGRLDEPGPCCVGTPGRARGLHLGKASGAGRRGNGVPQGTRMSVPSTRPSVTGSLLSHFAHASRKPGSPSDRTGCPSIETTTISRENGEHPSRGYALRRSGSVGKLSYTSGGAYIPRAMAVARNTMITTSPACA